MKKIILSTGIILITLAGCHSGNDTAAEEKTSNRADSVNRVLVIEEIEVAPGHYPEGITEYYKAHYPDESFKVWAHRDTVKSKARYYTKRNDEKLHFDSKGKFVNGIEEDKAESHAITVDNQ